jgi:hypothetical protein
VAEQVNFAYVLTEQNFKQVFTSVNSLLQNYNGKKDEISIYMISPNRYYMDLSPMKTKIDTLFQLKNHFKSWQLHCVPIANELAALGNIDGFGPIHEVPKCMLGDILPDITRVIFLRADTIVIRNIRPLWIDYRSDSFPFATVNGQYEPESQAVKYRHSIGCMVANLTLMKELEFSSAIQDIISTSGFGYNPDQDEDFNISPVDQAFYQYFTENANTSPTLPIRYDSIASSIPAKRWVRSYSTSDTTGTQTTGNKIEEFNQLTVINFAGIPNLEDFLENSYDTEVKWQYQKWILNNYKKYYISDATFPEYSMCCDYECCPDNCPCRSQDDCSPFPLHQWTQLGTFNIRFGVALDKMQ